MQKIFLISFLLINFGVANAQKSVVFTDDFNDNRHNWNAGIGSYYSPFSRIDTATIQKGCLKIKNHSQNYRGYWKRFLINQNKNYSVTAYVARTYLLGEPEYGLVWRGTGWDNFACVLVSSSFFKVMEVKNGKDKVLKDWTFSPNIASSFVFNKIEMRKENDSTKILINDSLVFASRYKKYFGQNTAIITGGRINIKVDFFEVRYFEEKINLQNDFLFANKKVQDFKLGDSIFSFTSPVLSQNSQKLFFSALSKSENDTAFSYNIFSSEKNSAGFWKNTQILSNQINNQNDNFPVANFESDSLFFFHNQLVEQKTQSVEFYNFKTESNETVRIEGYYNKYDFASFCLSADRKVLISSLKRADSFGRKDLYISFLTDKGFYSEPQNMGSALNTFDDEGTPFLSADNRRLFFYSYGHAGFGSSDIFVSERVGEGWQNWTTPKNLGKSVNSPFAEAFFVADKNLKEAYFVSNSEGDEKIFRVKIFKK